MTKDEQYKQALINITSNNKRVQKRAFKILSISNTSKPIPNEWETIMKVKGK
jgi:hypothetical protein